MPDGVVINGPRSLPLLGIGTTLCRSPLAPPYNFKRQTSLEFNKLSALDPYLERVEFSYRQLGKTNHVSRRGTPLACSLRRVVGELG